MSAEDQPAIDLGREADFQLGGLTVRPSRRELAAGAERSILEPRVMQALVALARSRGEVVSRDALIAMCWNGRIVGDDAINACVAKVRRAGEASGAYEIETIPRVGYRLTAGADSPAPATPVSGDALAVLPFDNLSPDPDLAYLSDGISEEILHTLARRSGLKVIGRASSFQFRGAGKAVADIASQLGVTHVLDGSVRRSGERLRISAQLIACATQVAVWADRFEREVTDVFALQDEVAQAVAQALNRILAPGPRTGAVDPVAYELYLRGSGFPMQNDRATVQTNIGLLEQAVRRAPDFAEAWGRLAFTRAALAYYLPSREAAVARQQAVDEAMRALGLDPRCAYAAIAMARTLPATGSFAGQRQWLERALAWAPQDSFAIHMHWRFLASTGASRDAVRRAREAVALDPGFLGGAVGLGAMLRDAGRLEEAENVFTDAAARWPEFEAPGLGLALTLAARRDFERAAAVLADHDLGVYRSAVGWFLSVLQDETRGRAIAGLRRQLGRSGRIDFQTMVIAAHLGHSDEALEIALQAELVPDPDAPEPAGADGQHLQILFSANMPEIRRDPRFVLVCAKLGLVDYWLASATWPDCVEEVAPYYDFKAECRRAAAGAPASG